MKNQTIYNMRLTMFADHLATIGRHPEHGLFTTLNLCELEEGKRMEFEVRYHDWVFEELLMFDEWSYNDFGELILEGMPQSESPAGGVCDFFGLDMDEFCHIFDIDGYQNIERLGGEALTEDSDGIAIANNIIALVHTRRKIASN